MPILIKENEMPHTVNSYDDLLQLLLFGQDAALSSPQANKEKISSISASNKCQARFETLCVNANSIIDDSSQSDQNETSYGHEYESATESSELNISLLDRTRTEAGVFNAADDGMLSIQQSTGALYLDLFREYFAGH